jgi:hypothetical protein
MPGHMNVLLAEADVPYEQLLDLEQADPQMPQTDAVLILGANDVVNPSARDDPGLPDLRDADPQRRPRPANGDRGQAEPVTRVRRDRQSPSSTTRTP